MPYRIITAQFAVPHDDPCFNLTDMRDEIQEALYDENGWSGSFKIVGAVTCPGTGFNAACFEDTDFDPATVWPNGEELIRRETEVRDENYYHVEGVRPDGTLGPDSDAEAPFVIFDTRRQEYVPGDFDTREDAGKQALRMNRACAAQRLANIASL